MVLFYQLLCNVFNIIHQHSVDLVFKKKKTLQLGLILVLTLYQLYNHLSVAHASLTDLIENKTCMLEVISPSSFHS